MKPINFFDYLHKIILFTFPFIAYIWLYIDKSGSTGILTLTGWIIIIIYYASILAEGPPKKYFQILLNFSPFIILATAYLITNTSLKSFFLEMTLVEVGTVSLGIMLLSLLGLIPEKFSIRFLPILINAPDPAQAIIGAVLIGIFAIPFNWLIFIEITEISNMTSIWKYLPLAAAVLTALVRHLIFIGHGNLFNLYETKNKPLLYQDSFLVPLSVTAIFLWLIILPIILSVIFH